MVIQGEPIYEGKEQTIVTNPMLITEVLSKSTPNYDQGEKFKYYRSIPQMKEYLLIDQKQFYVMQYIKNEAKQWVLTEYEGESATLKLNSVEFEIPFVSLYQGVNFANTEE
ncbi:MAG: Uma2 family endonuclease [Spirulina sp.]